MISPAFAIGQPVVVASDNTFWRVADCVEKHLMMGGIDFVSYRYDLINDITGRFRGEVFEYDIVPIKWPSRCLKEIIHVVRA